MKRFFLIVALALMFGFSVFADSFLMNLIDFGIDVADLASSVNSGVEVMNSADPIASIKIEARNAALNLDAVQRKEIYQSSKVGITGPFFMNMLVGFGSGHRMQGDLKGSLWIAPFDAAGIGIAATAALMYIVGYFVIAPAAHWTGSEYADFIKFGESSYGSICLWSGIAGLGVSVVTRLISCIRTVTWGNSYNRNLREGLGLDADLNIAFVPFVDNENMVGLSISGSLAF